MGELLKFSASFNRESPTATEVYLTTRSTVSLEARAYIGGLQFVNGQLVYVAPARQSDTGLICLSADFDIDYVGKGTDHVDLCELTVNYGIPETDESSDLGSVSVKLGGEMLALERGAYRWTSGSKTGRILSDEDDIKPFVVIPEATISVTNNFKDYVSLSSLTFYYGKVNSAALFIPGLQDVIPAGYARFDGVDVSKKFTTDGYQYFECQYTFATASHKWNELWNGSSYATVSPTLYNEANLNAVFQV